MPSAPSPHLSEPATAALGHRYPDSTPTPQRRTVRYPCPRSQSDSLIPHRTPHDHHNPPDVKSARARQSPHHPLAGILQKSHSMLRQSAQWLEITIQMPRPCGELPKPFRTATRVPPLNSIGYVGAIRLTRQQGLLCSSTAALPPRRGACADHGPDEGHSQAEAGEQHPQCRHGRTVLRRTIFSKRAVRELMSISG